MKARFLLIFLFFFSMFYLEAQDVIVTGIVKDAETNDFLSGTTIYVIGTTNGTVTDANGRYRLLNVPVEDTKLQISFLGYETKIVELQLKPGETKSLNIQLHPNSVMLGGVEITAQARGQNAAINRQRNATGVMNVISSEKLNELPDVNIADAIGRLPGLMIQRDGGEGQKIILRGLDPKYSTVAIDGMNVPSTSSNDRSTDLNMISPEMVSGVEVMKANTADKDADGLGGTINLVLRDAPSGFRLNTNVQSGYHTQISGIGHYKANILASNRFFDEKLGVILTSSAEQTDRSNDRYFVAYKVQGTPDYEAGETFVQPWITSTRLQSNLEKRNRYNLSLNMDYNLGHSIFKLSNLISSMKRDRDIREKRYDLEGNILRYNQTDTKSTETIISNMFQAEHNVLNSNINWGIGRTQSIQRKPHEHVLGHRMRNPFRVPSSELELLFPNEVSLPDFVDEDDLKKYYLYEGTNNTHKIDESELSAWLDWKYPFDFGSMLNGYFKFGGKYRQKDRQKDTNRNYVRFDLNTGFKGVLENTPDISRSSYNNMIGIEDFLDNNFRSSTFLNGDYENLNFNFALNRDYMAQFYSINSELYRNILTTKIQNDYSGHEKMLAGYFMAEVNISKYLTLIPGVRYDYTFMRYSAFSGTNVPDDETIEHSFDFEETEETGEVGYWLPQIHLRIKPTTWMDVRLAYTKTLSRPDYNLLMPSIIMKPTSLSISYSKTNLKPALSKNFDAIVSFYKPNVGLLTIGGFYKEIENFVYTRSALLLDGSGTDPKSFDLPEATAGWTITYPLNSPNVATIKGLEIDLQTQLTALPGILKGIVLGGNLTLMDSKMGYNETLIERKANPNFGIDGDKNRFIRVNTDTIYYDRLLKQPSLLTNVSLGYDYRGFSGRISYNYQDNILIKEQHRKDGADKETTMSFSRWDIQLKQKITKKISVYLSGSNIFNSPDKKKRDITGYPANIEYYGSSYYVGIRYNMYK